MLRVAALHESGEERPKANGRRPCCGRKAGALEGVSIAFRLARYGRDRASEFVKRRVGQRTSSHGGTYVYRRKGLLDGIPHVRLIRGVILVRTEDAAKLCEFLERMAAEVHARRVILTGEDRAALRV